MHGLLSFVFVLILHGFGHGSKLKRRLLRYRRWVETDYV